MVGVIEGGGVSEFVARSRGTAAATQRVGCRFVAGGEAATTK